MRSKNCRWLNDTYRYDDSKFYAGQYKQYQEASRDNERGNVLRNLRTAILRDAEDIASKYIRQNTTSNYAVLYIASEKLIDLVDDIENLRQDCLAEKRFSSKDQIL